MAACLLLACSKEEDTITKEKEEEIITGNTPSATSIRFNSTNKDCGITDGFANQQHTLSHLIHLNLDKCNNEMVRPTLTLTFENGKTIEPGTYTIASGTWPGAGEFIINSYGYSFTDWVGTTGSVVVTENTEDASKIDIELKSITMTNQKSDDTSNPSTDTLTGYIIKI